MPRTGSRRHADQRHKRPRNHMDNTRQTAKLKFIHSSRSTKPRDYTLDEPRSVTPAGRAGTPLYALEQSGYAPTRDYLANGVSGGFH